MTTAEILTELARLVTELSDDPVELTLESDLIDDVGLDSVDLIDLLCGASERWGVALELDDLDELAEPTRVACLIEYIDERLRDAEASGAPPLMRVAVAAETPMLERE